MANEKKVNISFSQKDLEYLVRALVFTYADNHQDFDCQDISDRGINALVLEKILANNNLSNAYYAAIQEKSSFKGPINKKLFLGAGHHSTVGINNLFKRLNFAVSELSAIQQNGGMGTEFDNCLDQDAKANIKSVIKDIIIAFGFSAEELCEPKIDVCDQCGYFHPGGTCLDS